MKNTEKIKEYFGNKAANYETNICKNMFWSTFKNTEKKVVVKFLAAKENDYILDIGSGPGIYAQELKTTNPKLLCIDSSFSMIKAVKQKGILGVVGNAENIPLNNVFDKILCLGVLEFVNRPESVIYQIKTHLKTDGCIVLIIPKKSIPGLIYKSIHKLHKLKVKLFTLSEMETILSNYGMQITAKKVLLDFACIIKAEPIPIQKS